MGKITLQQDKLTHNWFLLLVFVYTTSVYFKFLKVSYTRLCVILHLVSVDIFCIKQV